MSESAVPPKVLMVCGDFAPALSGIGDYAESLSRALADRDVAVTVLTTVGAGPVEDGAYRGRRIARAMRGWRFQDLRNLLREVDRLGEGAVVHIQYPGVAFGRHPMINLLPLALRALRPGVPVVVTFHDVRVMRRRWMLRVIPMLIGAHAVVYVDRPDREPLERLAPWAGNRMRWIPIATSVQPLPASPGEIERWRVELGLPGEEPVVVYFGIVYPHKGLLELVEAVEQVRRRGTPARLLVVGGFDRDTPFRAEVEAALAPGREAGWTVWYEAPPLDVVSRCLHAADLAALPFHSGASSNRSSLLAALAHGLPVITTDGAATPSDFANHFPVTLVPPRDVAALADAIERVVQVGLVAKSSSTPRRPFASDGWSEIATRTQRVYQEAVGWAG